MAKKASEKTPKASAEELIKEIRRNTQKILIVMEGMRSELSVAKLCRKYGISLPTYYKWLKEFIEAGKKRLSGDEQRESTSEEVRSYGSLQNYVRNNSKVV